MAEFVCELSEYGDEMIEQRERIIRCRDCRWIRGYTRQGEMICLQNACSPIPVDLNGFCYKGERS